MNKRNSSKPTDDAIYGSYRSNSNKNKKLSTFGARRSLPERVIHRNVLELKPPLVVSQLKKAPNTKKSPSPIKNRNVSKPFETKNLKQYRTNTTALRAKSVEAPPVKIGKPYYMVKARAHSSDQPNILKNNELSILNLKKKIDNAETKSWILAKANKLNLCSRHVNLINFTSTPSSSTNVKLDKKCRVCQDVTRIMELRSNDRIKPEEILQKNADQEFITNILNKGNDLLLKKFPETEASDKLESCIDTMPKVAALLDKHVARLIENNNKDTTIKELSCGIDPPKNIQPSSGPTNTAEDKSPVEASKEHTSKENDLIKKSNLSNELIKNVEYRALQTVDNKPKENLVGYGKLLSQMMERHKEILTKLQEYETENRSIQNFLASKSKEETTFTDEGNDESVNEDIDTKILDYLIGKKR